MKTLTVPIGLDIKKKKNTKKEQREIFTNRIIYFPRENFLFANIFIDSLYKCVYVCMCVCIFGNVSCVLLLIIIFYILYLDKHTNMKTELYLLS